MGFQTEIKTPSLEEESAMNGDSSSASRLLPPPSTALPKSLSEPADLRAKRKRPDLSGPPKSSPPCSECGKRFSSSKALFGHMRCHPEREWRGIHPPPPPQPPPPMMTGRAPFTPEEQQVAATLILLANSPSSDSAASGEIAGSAVIRSLSASFDGVLWRRRRQQMQESCKDARFLDLNLPPPLDSCEADGRTPSPLDLKLRL